jgi:hypothetical protein
MKKFYLFSILVLSAPFGIITLAQESYSPAIVRQAAFFDQTPPLKDMPMLLPKPKDNSWKWIVKNESLEIRNEANKDVITDELSVQKKMGSKSVNGPITTIEGIGNVNGVYPPDPNGAVGPNHYFQMMNLSFAIYNKQGTLLYGPVANSTLWNGFPGPWSGTNDGDPIMLYDHLADRWVASQFAVYTSNNKYYELIAVSQSGDPLGAWNRYAFEFDYFPDYPKLSVWPDGYYATFHMFSGSYKGMAAVAFERDKMLAGDPTAQMVYFGEYGSRYGYLPADLDGNPPPPGTPCNIIGINFWGNQNMEVWKLVPDWTNTANSTFMLEAVLPTASFSTNISGIAQPGTGTQLDAITNIVMFRLPYRNFGTHSSIVANHTVRVGNIAGIRWYELRNTGSGWSIYQQGTYQPDNHHRWMGSIAMAANGNIALGYSVSSSTVHPSIRYTGRTPDAPLGEMNLAEVEIASGNSSQSGINRWGDYSCMNVDPSNDTVFWFTAEYMKGSGWGTKIASFDFGEIQPPVAFAGEDVSICVDELFEANATAQNQSSVMWTTSGDGVFQNVNIINTKYLRGNGDIANGSVTLTLTAYGFQSGWEHSDDVVVTIIKQPVANAGPDTTIHYNQPLALNGVAENYSSVIWATSGDGYFSNDSVPDPVYYPGPSDISTGQVNLTFMAHAIQPCTGSASDAMTVMIDPATGIEQTGQTQLAMTVKPNPSDGVFTLEIAGMMNQESTLTITDLSGNTIMKQNLTGKGDISLRVDLTSYPKGMYIIDISSGDVRKSQRIVKD